MRLVFFKSQPDADVDPHADTGLIALWLPPAAARLLAAYSEETVGDLHITVAYLGSILEQPPDTLAQIVSALAPAITAFPPFTVVIGGAGSFPPSDGSDGQYVRYAKVMSPSLLRLHDLVVATLAGLGIAPATQHAYTPHVTLGYSDTPPPPVAVPARAVRCTELTLIWGERRLEIPFQIQDEPWPKLPL